MTKKEVEKTFENVHWADNSAQRTIDTFQDEEVYTLASGITPSGYIHIGNFREVITTEIVRRALNDKGKKTKFIYSWDSYDAFRKVPSDVPQEWSKYLRMPVGVVPNPFNSQAESYGEHFIQTFEEEIKAFNFPVEFQKQHIIQSSGVYADSIKEVLNNKDIVIEELNKYRGEDQQLSSLWWPIDVYDDETKRDTNEIISFDGEYTLRYKIIEEGDLLGVEKQVNFKEDPRVKLRWKADWPMRWNYFKVCFEPGGKDHSTPGSSYTVGKEIIKRIFSREAPVYTMYDFVLQKGIGGKISSSKGGALRVRDVLDIYTPEMVLFMFAGTRPNSEIHISFDQDVIKLYEDFDKLERLYFGFEQEKNEKQRVNKLRQYELSLPNGVEVPNSLPFQPQFRHLSVLAQVHNSNFEKVREYFEEEINTAFDERRLEERFNCVVNWLEKYATEEFIFALKSELGEITTQEEKVVKYLQAVLPQVNSTSEIVPHFKNVSNELGMEMKEFFKHAYMVTIGKEKGPKLSSFIIDHKNMFEKLLTTPYSINNSKYKVESKEDLSDFSKLRLQIGEIIDTQIHPESDELLVLQIKISSDDIRSVVFGCDNGYVRDDLIGKNIVVLTNIKSSKFKGVESQAMIVACLDESNSQEDSSKEFGILFANNLLTVGDFLEYTNPQTQIREVANNDEYITKEFLLSLPLKGVEGALMFNEDEVENVEIDKQLSGKIL